MPLPRRRPGFGRLRIFPVRSINRVFGRRRYPIDQLQKIRVHVRRAFGDKLPPDQNVLPAKCHGIDAELARHAVHHAFHRPRGLNLSRGARVSRRNFVGVGAPSMHLQVRNSIATPSRNDRVMGGRRRAGGIGPGVHDQLDLQSRDGAVELHADLRLEEHRVTGILQETFLRGRNQLDRSAADFSRQEQSGQVRIDDVFRAEAAADVGHPEPHVFRRHFEEMSDFVAVAIGRIGRHPQIDFPVSELSDAAADIFHGMMKHCRGGIGLLKDAFRLFKAALDIAPLELVFEQKIAALLLMHQRRRRAERLAAVVDVRQRLITDIDKIDRLLRRAQTVRRDDRDDFAVEPNFVDGDKRLIFGQFEMLVSRQRPQRMKIGQMISMQYADNTGKSFRFARVYGDDFCVGVRARQHRAVEQSGGFWEIFDIFCAAGYFRAHVDARSVL